MNKFTESIRKMSLDKDSCYLNTIHGRKHIKDVYQKIDFDYYFRQDVDAQEVITNLIHLIKEEPRFEALHYVLETVLLNTFTAGYNSCVRFKDFKEKKDE